MTVMTAKNTDELTTEQDVENFFDKPNSMQFP